MKEINIVNNLRVLGCESITNARSGHPGVVLSAAPIFYSVFKNLKVDKNNLKYFNRDFFVNSAGHSSSLHYATMNLFDLNLKTEDLKQFRKLNSKTPGHPEISTEGIDCATGPLGQGVSNSVGIALAQKHFASIFNKPGFEIFSSHTFCFLGDGCLMEGVALEGFSLASKLKLNNLIFIYDRNKMTIEGSLDIAFSEDVVKKFKALNFNVIEILDGNDIVSIDKAITLAKQNKDYPTIIIVNTKIGFGSHLEDNKLSHGKPFNKEEIEILKKNLGVKSGEFELEKGIREYIEKINAKKEKILLKEKKILNEYMLKYKDDYEKLQNYFNFSYNKLVFLTLSKLNVNFDEKSTRDTNHYALNEIGKTIENLIGGCADVNTSTRVYFENEGYINESYKNRNIHFGVREHAMAAICNGLCLFGGLNAFCSCYLSFSDYLKPALRMSCLMNLPIIYEFSHDNILIGEDGPTHQPVEQLISLRATPNLTTFRPYNLTEILGAYKYYFKEKKPTCLILSKEKVTNNKGNINNTLKGGYVIFKEIGKLNGVIISSGMEVELSIEVAKKLKGIRVVSMPSIELFNKQSEKYKNEVLTEKPKIALEMSSSYSYHKLVKDGLYLTNDDFGKSGSSTDLRKEYGLNVNDLCKKIKKFLKSEYNK